MRVSMYVFVSSVQLQVLDFMYKGYVCGAVATFWCIKAYIKNIGLSVGNTFDVGNAAIHHYSLQWPLYHA